jgi:hypothetical protein
MILPGYINIYLLVPTKFLPRLRWAARNGSSIITFHDFILVRLFDES